MIPRRFAHPISAALAALAMLTAASSAASSNFTWIGGDGDWVNPLNWIGGVLPSAGDSVFIDGGKAIASFVTISGAVEIANLSLDSGDTVKLTSGSSLSVTGNVSFFGTLIVGDTGSVLNVAGSFTGRGTVTNGGNVTLNTGAGIGIPGGSLTLTGTGGGNTGGGTVTNGGNVTLNTGAGIGIPGGSLTLTGGGNTQNPVTVVPEPDAYALMLGGLALLGCMAVRRRRALPA